MKRDFEYSQVAGEDGKKYYDMFRNYVYFQNYIIYIYFFFLELHFHEYDELNGVSKGRKNISCERSWCPQWKHNGLPNSTELSIKEWWLVKRVVKYKI